MTITTITTPPARQSSHRITTGTPKKTDATLNRNPLFNQLQSNWNHIQPEKVNQAIQHFLSTPASSKDIQATITNLLGPTVKYSDREALYHLSHLHSWTGPVRLKGIMWTRTERWPADNYPPLKMQALLKTMAGIHRGTLPAARFGESKDQLLTKLKNEIQAQTAIYFTALNQKIVMKASPQEKQSITHTFSRNYCEKANNLKPGETLSVYAGFPGHALYMDIEKQANGNYLRSIYNLGPGLEFHQSTPDGRYFPFIESNIPATSFQKGSSGEAYFQRFLAAQAGLSNPLEIYGYDPKKMSCLMGGIPQRTHIRQAPQKQQLASNCVVKNNNASQRGRLNNLSLFNYLKAEEDHRSRQASGLKAAEYDVKEGQRSTDSVKFILRHFQKNKNSAATIANFNRFFDKRLSLPAAQQGTTGVTRLAAYIQHHRWEPELGTWLKIKGTVDTLKFIAEKTGSQPLQAALTGIPAGRE